MWGCPAVPRGRGAVPPPLTPHLTAQREADVAERSASRGPASKRLQVLLGRIVGSSGRCEEDRGVTWLHGNIILSVGMRASL